VRKIYQSEFHRSDSTAQKNEKYFLLKLLRVVFAFIIKAVILLFCYAISAKFIQKERLWGDPQNLLNYSKIHLHRPN